MERADAREPDSPTPSSGRTVRHPSPKEYVRIAVVLAVVTGMEVGIWYAEISRGLLILALLVLAAIKFVLVVLWYMHLRFDSRTYARFFMIGLAGAVTLYLVVLLTFRAFSGGA
ncbi:MAG: cytochrome C oxidase subunit IV family protein [Actinomycetota bacterium]